MIKELNFPKFKLSFKNKNNKSFIFDIIRKKWVFLSREEWVRQNCIHFLINVKKYPIGLIQLEKKVEINSLSKRYDIVCYNKNGSISLLVECKSPEVKINQNTFDQIIKYNLVLNSDYLMITNGLEHFFFKMDFKNIKYLFLTELPLYNSILE